MPLLRHEADPAAVGYADDECTRARKMIYAGADEHSKASAQASFETKPAAVHPFIVNGRVEWHVFKVSGTQAKWHAGPFVGPGNMGRDEAMFCARDVAMGRVSVKHGSIRGLFKARGRILVPSGEIDKPGDPSPKLTVHGDGGMVVG